MILKGTWYESCSCKLFCQTVRVGVTGGDSPHVTVEGIADIAMERVKTEDGKQTVVLNGPVAVGFAR